MVEHCLLGRREERSDFTLGLFRKAPDFR
jgi:hypothetical protein